MTTEPARRRLEKTAREFGVVVDLAQSATACEAIEGHFFAQMIAGIRQKAADSDWRADLIDVLLKRMPADHDDVALLIERIDDNDGWPECRVLNAIKGLHCALTFRDAASRWLAEAALQVGELHVGDGPDGFRGDAKAWAGARLVDARNEVIST